MKKYLLFVFSICFLFISISVTAQNSVVVTAFFDEDADGIDNNGFFANGLTNAELILWQDVDASGTITGADVQFSHVEGAGMYTFDNAGAGLPDGDYILQYIETPWTPANITSGNGVYVITLLNVGAATTDNDVDPISGTSPAFNVSGGATEMNIDIGLYFATAIGDFVWEDVDGNGLQDAGEPGIDGVLITLLDGVGAPAVDTDGITVPTQNTVGGGDYLFGNLPQGVYIVQFSLPTIPGNWFATTYDGGDPDFSNDSDANPANLFQSFVYTTETNPDGINNIYNENIDAGFIQAVSIGDQVWEDLNGDGVQDAGEPGINGVMVSLFDDTGAAAIGANGLAVPVQITANVAGTDGIYTFTDIAPGQYQVEFALPAPIGTVAWYPTAFDPADVEPDDSDTDSDASNNPADGVNYLRTAFITVESAETDEELRIDAGFWLPAIVGDKVFCDENGNGIDDDGVGGVDGVDVTLIDAVSGFIAQDAEGNNLTTTTASGGMYMFELVPPGMYYLQFQLTGATPDPPFVFTIQNEPTATELTDSDVDPNPGGTMGQTEQFEIISQDTEEEEKWDAGVYQLINIIGTVWIESDGNSMLDVGESGPGNVFMEIFNAADDSKAGDAFTNTGVYEFIGYPPGDYYISFDITGTPLETATPCPGSNDANDMVDNDDNGDDGIVVTTTTFTALSNCDPTTPPEIFYVDFCYFFDCNMPNPLAATACAEVLDPDIICDISILGSFCNLMPAQNSPGNQPNPLCPDGGGPHNISWFAFVAYGGNYSITVTPTGCMGSTTGQEGVQIGLYTDCTFSETVYCDPACSTDPVTFDSSILIEGQTYYFFIDGCSSSQCSYQVDIVGDPLPPNLLPVDVCIVDPTSGLPVCEDATYCPDAVIDFIATDFNLTVNFSWTVTATAGGPYDGNAIEMTEDEILSLAFPNEGVYQVCLTQVDNGCAAQQWNGNICRQVTIVGIDSEVFDTITVCNVEDFTDISLLMPMDPNGDGTNGWQGGPPPFMEGTNMVTITNLDGCMYDQEFVLMLFPESAQGLVDSTVCLGELPLSIDGLDITALSFLGSLEFEFLDYTLPNIQDQNGCDSIIDINIELLDIAGGEFLDTLICIPEGLIMQFDYFVGLSTAEEFLTFEWFDPIGDPLPDTWNPTNPLDNVAPVGINGTYMLTITIMKNGKTCTYSYTKEVNFDDFLPINPEISGPGLEVCEADSIVTYTAINFGDASIFTWDFPADVASFTLSGANDEILTINWSGSVGGTVSLVSANLCGVSDQIDIDITVIPQPTPSFNFITEACIDSCIIIEFIGDDSNIGVWNWDFDGGIESNGTGSTGTGPHCVSWPDAGDKTITLSYTDNSGCVSTITTETVSVIAPIAPPIINCNPNTGEVSFTWDDVPGNLGYTVEVTSISTVTSMLHEGVLSGTTFTVGNLADGETVTIIVTILTDDACESITATSPGCTSQDCTAPTIELTADTTSFCLNVNSGPATITAVITSGENGTGVYSGPGIVDAVNGIFDPNDAGIGIHTITYLFMTDDLPTPCIGNESIQIEVKETPVASFSSDVDTICITDQFNLTYDGTPGVAYTWDYGVDGTGGGGPNPSVTYTTPGDKTILLTVLLDGCESISFPYNVFVQPELEDLVITCSIQEIDEVEFSWDPVPGATGYSVSVDNGPPFTTTQTSHGETGLNPNQIVTITITVLTDSRCPGGTFMWDCTAVTCPSFEITFIDPPGPNICVDGTYPIETLVATAMGGAGDGEFFWSGPNVTDDQFDPNGLAEGPHEIRVIYEEGSCQGDSFFIVNITETPLAAFSVDNTTICVGDTVNITYEGSQLPGQTIMWTSGGEDVIDGANPNEYIAVFNSDGTFNIQLDVMNGNCPTAPAMATITVEPELDFGDITCMEELDQITFNWDAVDCATEYRVFTTIDSGSEVLQGTQTGTQYIESGLAVGVEVYIRVIAISDCACGDVMQDLTCETTECTNIDLDIFAIEQVYTFCNTDDLGLIELMASPVGTLGGGTGEWTGPGIDDTNETFDPSVAGVGTHTVYYDFLESEGCPHRDSLSFTINELPTVSLNFDPIACADQTNTILEVIPSGGFGDYTITLDGFDAGLMNDVTAGNYVVVIMDENDCTATDSTVIAAPIDPSIAISGSTELVLGDSSTYSISSTEFDGSTIDSIIWTANGSLICNDPGCFSLDNQIPTDTTEYAVIVHYNSGCSVTDSLDVLVTDPPIVSIFEIPNIISPNGDGVNDTWQIVSNDELISVSSINVFDRWGNKVWGFGPFMAMGNTVTWDGLYNGKVLQPGVYVYFVNFVQDGRAKVRSGDITIIN